MQENKVSGSEDNVVTEMIQLPLEYNMIAECFQDGARGSSRSLEDCTIGLLEETRRGAKERNQEFHTCVILRLEREKGPEELKQLHVGEVDGISCQHLQVMMTHLLQKHREWQED